jgi:hypothetical protein
MGGEGKASKTRDMEVDMGHRKCTRCSSVDLEYGRLSGSNTPDIFFNGYDRGLLEKLSGLGKGSISAWVCL